MDNETRPGVTGVNGTVGQAPPLGVAASSTEGIGQERAQHYFDHAHGEGVACPVCPHSVRQGHVLGASASLPKGRLSPMGWLSLPRGLSLLWDRWALLWALSPLRARLSPRWARLSLPRGRRALPSGRLAASLAGATAVLAVVAVSVLVLGRDSTTDNAGAPHSALPAGGSVRVASAGGQSSGDSGATSSAGTSPGITFRSTISESGSLRTRAQIQSERPLSALTLSVPSSQATMTGQFDPQVSHLLIRVDGNLLTGVPSRVLAGQSARVALPPGTEVVHLTYRAGGVVAVSQPSVLGRALVLATPLQLTAPTGLPTTMVLQVQGAQILNLGCWPPGKTPEACGEPAGDGWVVHTEATAGTVDVVAQADLSATASS